MAGKLFNTTNNPIRLSENGDNSYSMTTITQFRRVKTIYGAFDVSTTAVSKAINGANCTVHILSGNCWINPNATAVADDTSIKLTTGMVIDMNVSGNLSLISDATGASVQIIVWED